VAVAAVERRRLRPVPRAPLRRVPHRVRCRAARPADRVVPPPFVQEWQEVLPHAEVAMIPNGGHLLLDEFPAAVEALRAFLRG